MPVYDYLCKRHGPFEANQPIAKRQYAECPQCKQASVRQFSAMPAVHYKGTGWYSIDSGKRFESQLSKDGKQKYQKARAEGKL